MNIIYLNTKHDKKHRKESTEDLNWLLQLKSGDMSTEKRDEFAAWLSGNPKNAEEFQHFNALWEATEILKTDRFTTKVLNRRRVRRTPSHEIEGSGQPRSRSFMIRWLSVAAVILLIVVGVFFAQYSLDSEEIYRTATGEHRSIYLSDGSVIHLASETKIRVFFTPEERHFTMETGKALFSVAYDPERPFVVSIDTLFIQAIGTKFLVNRLNKAKLSVSVTEGKAQITKKTTDTIGEKEIIDTGETIIVNEQENTYQVKPVDINQIISWQNGRLYFSRALLPDVICEVNRYLKKKIVIGDPRLDTVEINMNFDIEHCKYFLNTLNDSVPIDNYTNTYGQIVIKKRD
jgi:transmembrane sensor